VRGGQGAREWAECAWLGFGAIEPPPDSFVAFAGNMAKSDAISLLYIEGAATGMLCAADGTAGIYYVSTQARFRGRGLGGIVVETLKRRALEMGFGRITLLATPSGLPLYLKHGFRDNGAVKIYKTGE
jgi:GNAT superfamily N-acetyltransferase